MNITNWYLRVMEEGVDTKNISQDYLKLKDEYKELQKSSQKTIKTLTNQLTKTKESLKKALEKLNQQQKEVVIPLIGQAMK